MRYPVSALTSCMDDIALWVDRPAVGEERRPVSLILLSQFKVSVFYRYHLYVEIKI